MKKIIYGVVLTVLIAGGTNALFCPGQLDKTQIKELARDKTVSVEGSNFTPVSPDDREAAVGAALSMGNRDNILMTKGEQVGGDKISPDSQTVTCSYRFQSAKPPQEVFNIKISRPLKESERNNLERSKTGGAKGLSSGASLLKEKIARESGGK